ncbi:hypothetical protein BDZ97DRAFT_2079119 [Flammula alnicola]|nr:hypothetical protein BDZ97DRAFT_2079119 [Flammula alnicola]
MSSRYRLPRSPSFFLGPCCAIARASPFGGLPVTRNLSCTPVGGGSGGNAPGAHDLSQQSIWTSSYPSQSQNSQQNLVGALSSTPFAHPVQTMLPSASVTQRQQHHRIPSSSVAA